jgi:hypothetical protein
MLSKTINGKEYLFVEIEKASSDFWLDKGELHYLWGEDYVTIQLPTKTKMKIIGKASELTEEQWREIVENDPINWFLFKSYESVLAVGYHFAHQSGKSLLRTLGLEPKTTLIIEKLC